MTHAADTQGWMNGSMMLRVRLLQPQLGDLVSDRLANRASPIAIK